MGPNSQTNGKRMQMEKQFADIINYLLFNNIDFDFISESLLPGQYINRQDDKFTVSEIAYDVVLIPNCINIRKITIGMLSDFVNRGGEAISIGEFPKYQDCIRTDFPEDIKCKFVNIPFEESSIVEVLHKYRDIWIYDDEGKNSDNLIYNMRTCDDGNWLFIAHAFPPSAPEDNRGYVESESIEKYSLDIMGEYDVLLYDTMDSNIYSYPSRTANGKTRLELRMYGRQWVKKWLISKYSMPHFHEAEAIYKKKDQ